jgi:Fe-S cluster assembly iron-binding protein IscA
MHQKKIADKENTMFEITEKAVSMLKEFLKDRNDPLSIRVAMMEGG